MTHAGKTPDTACIVPELSVESHPVDVFVYLAEKAGFDLDPNKIAEARRICDQPVGGAD